MSDKSVTLVYETMNYGKFRKLEYNRILVKSRKDKLVASFSARYVLNPIVVNEKFEIIDGQGRYEAWKELGLPIRYIIVKGTGIEDCRRMNQYNTKWEITDWIASYAEAGRESYARLKRCHDDTKCPYSRIMRLAGHGLKKRQGEPSPVETGDLYFTSKDAEAVKAILEKCDEVASALCASERKNDAYYIAVKVMGETEGFEYTQFLEKCKACRGTYHQMSSLEAQLVEFSRIYNYRRSVSSRLYFERYMENKGHNVRGYEGGYFSGSRDDTSTLSKE